MEYTQLLLLLKQEDLEEELVKAEALDQVHNLLNQEILELLDLVMIQDLEVQVHLIMDTQVAVELDLQVEMEHLEAVQMVVRVKM